MAIRVSLEPNDTMHFLPELSLGQLQELTMAISDELRERRRLAREAGATPSPDESEKDA